MPIHQSKNVTSMFYPEIGFILAKAKINSKIIKIGGFAADFDYFRKPLPTGEELGWGLGVLFGLWQAPAQ